MQSEAKRKYREKNRDILNAKERERYHNNLEREKLRNKLYQKNNPEKSRERCNRWIKNNPEKAMLGRAKQRAKRKGLDFTITLKDIIIPKKCPVFGLTLSTANGKQAPNSPSLDRIDNDKGYIPSNIIVISNKANHIKNSGTPDEHIRIGMFFKSKTEQIKQQEHAYGYYE